MTIRLGLAFAAALTLLPTAVAAQNSMVSSLAEVHAVTRTNILATARDVPQELYTYRPTEEVRSMGELLGHIANAQYFFCSTAAGEASPATGNAEESAGDKAAIVAALEASFAYCDGVYAGMTDAQAAQPRDFPIAEGMTAGSVLSFNSMHNYEHYGNLVTYMRMNGIVPPSSR